MIIDWRFYGSAIVVQKIIWKQVVSILRFRLKLENNPRRYIYCIYILHLGAFNIENAPRPNLRARST
jgi:hypothetical protein